MLNYYKIFSYDYHPGDRRLHGAAVIKDGSTAYVVGCLTYSYDRISNVWKFESIIYASTWEIVS